MTSDALPSRSDGSPSADDGWDEARITRTRNTARYFVENRSIAWILLVSVVFWGLYGYASMPKQKDPTIPVRVAVAETQWLHRRQRGSRVRARLDVFWRLVQR